MKLIPVEQWASLDIVDLRRLDTYMVHVHVMKNKLKEQCLKNEW